jgi:hypothetical protein
LIQKHTKTKIVYLNNLKSAAMLFYRSSFLMVLFIILSSQKAADAGRTYTYDDGEVEVLNGHVKQIISYHESTLGLRFLDTITTNFDKKGYQTEVFTATPTGQKSKETLNNVYDKTGRAIQTSSPGSLKKGSYNYTKNGYTIKVLFGPESEHGSELLYVYDNNSYLTELDYYEKPKALVDIIKYKYDKSNRVIETVQTSAKGQVKLTRTFEYKAYVVDAKNNWVKEKMFTKDIYPSFVNKKMHDLTRKIIYY